MTALAVAFLEAAGRPTATTAPELEDALGRVWAQARSAWPALEVEPEAFVRHLGGRLADDPPSLEAALSDLGQGEPPARLHAADLYLAAGCASGSPRAIAELESRYDGELRRVFRRFTGQGRTADDLRQILRERLFVATPRRGPRIVEYRGTGPLGAWLRVTATRTCLDETRRVARREPEELGATSGILDLAGQGSWELDYLKAHYREAFRQAFSRAAAALPCEQRNLLRYHHVEGLTIDQIASLYPYHRSSVARRLQRAREDLIDATQEELSQALRVEETELKSIMQLIQSHLHLSLARVLASRADRAIDPGHG